jgi:hypothetical protein
VRQWVAVVVEANLWGWLVVVVVGWLVDYYKMAGKLARTSSCTASRDTTDATRRVGFAYQRHPKMITANKRCSGDRRTKETFDQKT